MKPARNAVPTPEMVDTAGIARLAEAAERAGKTAETVTPPTLLKNSVAFGSSPERSPSTRDDWRDRGEKEPKTCRYCGETVPPRCEEIASIRLRVWAPGEHECDGYRQAREAWLERKRTELLAEFDALTPAQLEGVRKDCNLLPRSLAGLGRLTLTKENRAAIEQARELLQQFQSGDRSRGLYLHGPLGTGKTALLAALAFDLRLRTGKIRDRERDLLLFDWGTRASVQFWPVPDLFTAINRAMDDRESGFSWRTVERCDALLLDDLGKQYDTGWKMSELFRVVNYRYQAMLSTSFTSNYSPDELAARMVAGLGKNYASDVAAMLDRIEETCEVVELRGHSWRQKGRR